MSAGTPLPESFGLGAAPSAQRVSALDIDVNAAGTGLPDGSGTYAQGAVVYGQKCALCHGAKGEGNAAFPRLIGIEHRQDFAFSDDPKLQKTIGNYWPYATTLYDYINRAMPFSTPGSLRPAEVYSLVAFLLSENAVVSRSVVMDRESLPRVVMPARSHFKPDDRTGGSSFR